MSPQDPNRATDLPGRESAEISTPMRDESRQGAAADPDGSTGDGRMPGRRRLGPVIAVVVLGWLSFVVGLQMLSVAKTIAPAGGNERAAIARSDGNEWAAIALADGNGPAPQIPVAPLAKPRETDPMPDPESGKESLPPETFAFAGKQAGEEWSANGLGMRFCWCPAGTFIMGSPEHEKEREPGPYGKFSEDQVEVKFTKGFWLGKYETTQSQWEELTGTTLKEQFKKVNDQLNLDYMNSRTEEPRSAWAQSAGEGPNYPMYYVNHAEATAFCQQLTAQERTAGRLPPGWEFRLPTDAQWEYACRAATETATAFGNQLGSHQANFRGNYPYNGALKGPGLGRMAEVGRYRQNAWGFCDMHGNAQEWCRDCYQATLPGGTDPEVTTNPWRANGEADRVVRGGSWQNYGSDCRSARRFGSAPTNRDNSWGFRVAIVLPNPKPRLSSRPDPKPLPRGSVINSIGMKLAAIPGGRFLMGSPRDEVGRRPSGLGLLEYEEQHEETIRESFYLGIYLVTQEQYQYVMDESPNYGPSNFSHKGAQKEAVKEFKDTKGFPADSVSWNDAQEFCRRLSALPAEKARKRFYRLPTEAEWEYACRAGTSTRFYVGDTLNSNQANFNGNVRRTTPVGYYANPNKFGLYDMHGNLWEWCDDFFVPYQKAPRNPKSETSQVMRGGSFINYSIDCRSASRSGNSSDYRHCTVGFRVALSVGARTR